MRICVCPGSLNRKHRHQLSGSHCLLFGNNKICLPAAMRPVLEAENYYENERNRASTSHTFSRLSKGRFIPYILMSSNKTQQYAGIYLLQNYWTCFGCPSHPSSGVLKTVTAASGTGHSIWATTFFQRGQIWPSLYMFRVSIAPIIRST